LRVIFYRNKTNFLLLTKFIIMKKKLLKTICIALVAVLCVANLNAQNSASTLKNVTSAERAAAELNIQSLAPVVTPTIETPSNGSRAVVLNETFSSPTLPAGWLNVDVDGDGYKWQFTQTNSGCADIYPEGHNDDYCINSASYYNCVGALSPNNWVITPALSLGASTEISWWVKTVDAAYSAEHYGVYISTTGTNPSDFTLLFEETLNSSYANNFVSKTVNTTIGGSNCYIAFRHFNSYDVYIFCIDDIMVTTEGAPTNVTITTEVNPADAGTATGGGTFAVGAAVTLTATANEGYEFVNWTVAGTEVSTTPAYTFTAAVDVTVTANFVLSVVPCDPVTITTTVEDGNIIVDWGVTKMVNVYRNDASLATNVDGTSYKDENPLPGENCYKVEVICEGGVSEKSDASCKTIENSIKDITKAAFSIVPNPATNGSITITASNNFNTVEIVNFLGQTFISQNNDKKEATVDVSNLTNGVYFVRIVGENGTSVQKFVKK
jgi:hypothetical protein